MLMTLASSDPFAIHTGALLPDWSAWKAGMY